MVAYPLLNPEGLWTSEILAFILPHRKIIPNKMAETHVVFRALHEDA
jgi:hypothetical protein